MPFRAHKLLKFISPFVSRYTLTLDESVYTDDPDTTKKFHYCASLTAEVLQNVGYFKDVDVYELTANDVVVYLLARGACVETEIPLPTAPPPNHAVPGIVRSREWMDLNYF